MESIGPNSMKTSVSRVSLQADHRMSRKPHSQSGFESENERVNQTGATDPRPGLPIAIL